jgi:Flp pilus assembly protein TadD
VLVAAFMMLTFQRAVLFDDAVLLFMDGTLKTLQNPVAPYQLGRALEAQKRDEDAIVAYREVLSRTRNRPVIITRRAENALASIHARHGRLEEAERILRVALEQFPGDPVVRNNLAKVLRGLGRVDEANAMAPTGPVKSDEH